MAICLTGQDLTISDLVRAARRPGKVSVSAEALGRMQDNRSFAERARARARLPARPCAHARVLSGVAARGDEVYGLSTGVGSRKTRRISTSELVTFNKRMIRDHATGQGPAFRPDVARAAALVLLNSLAAGRTNVRPQIAERFAQRLSNGPVLSEIPIYGTTGIGDVTPLAHLVTDLLGAHLP